MEKNPSIEQTAQRIVDWAAHNPLGARETEERYAHLLAGLQPIPAGKPGWSIFALGKLAVRYWKDRVEEVQQSLDDLRLSPALALRGGGPAEAKAAAERILKAKGRTGAACVKITENPDHATVALALWLEPASAEADAPFTVTVLAADQSNVAGPVECAGGRILRFASVSPGAECSILFKTKAETWQIRWGLSPAST